MLASGFSWCLSRSDHLSQLVCVSPTHPDESIGGTEMIRGILAASILIAMMSTASGMCYTVYGPNDQILVRSITAPVDMSLPLSVAVKDRFANGYLVASADNSACSEIDNTAMLASGTSSKKLSGKVANPGDILRASDISQAGYGSNHGSSDPYVYRRDADAGNDVHVNSYRRADGTVVRGYDRAAPGRGRK